MLLLNGILYKEERVAGWQAMVRTIMEELVFLNRHGGEPGRGKQEILKEWKSAWQSKMVLMIGAVARGGTIAQNAVQPRTADNFMVTETGQKIDTRWKPEIESQVWPLRDKR